MSPTHPTFMSPVRLVPWTRRWLPYQVPTCCTVECLPGTVPALHDSRRNQTELTVTGNTRRVSCDDVSACFLALLVGFRGSTPNASPACTQDTFTSYHYCRVCRQYYSPHLFERQTAPTAECYCQSVCGGWLYIRTRFPVDYICRPAS
jgi:hypothetical protein